MCGIAGLVDPGGLPGWEADARILDRALRHRGPDDHGVFTDAHRGEVPARLADGGGPHALPRVVLLHRRLSILDLSPAARQPMVRDDGRLFVSYNGELYNYRELRAELARDGAVFRTTSDTEVLVEAYRRWGAACVGRLRGMFAFAIADLAHGTLLLARDHLGVKPLYVARVGTRWAFASELKALAALPSMPRTLDPAAMHEYLQFLWIGSERTGLRDIRKLAPGTWLEIELATGAARAHTYWTPLRPDLVAARAATREDTVAHLRGELQRAVTEQLVSDVPLGAFLSGGLDSSLVVALMTESTRGRVATYSVGYAADDLAYDIVPDDLPFAREVSRELGVDNTELVLSPDVAALLPAVVEALDEPLGDPAAISSYLIARAAKPSVTVMLSGVGADEVFGGYPRQRAMLYGRAFRRLPRWLQRGARGMVARMPGAGRGVAAKVGRAGKKFLAAADEAPLAHYVAMESYFRSAQRAALVDPAGPLAADSPLDDELRARAASIAELVPDDPLKQAVLWDLGTYLPALNLAYTDRTSMAHGLEVRVPYLDVQLVEWALALRADELIGWRRGRLEGKRLLKQAAAPWLPARIIHRRKAGFGAPVRSWLRGELTALRRELLDGLGRRGWFAPAALATLERDFLAGRADHALQLWMLMSLELWARRFL